MKIDILFPVLPPTIDGIGDHTARLAAALSGHAQVRILSAQASYDPIDGVDVVQAFSMRKRSGVLQVADVVARDPPDWLFVQFNQFSYGKWGLNPFLPMVLRTVKKRNPRIRIAWMAHEDFVPFTSWRFAVMTTWQRAQFLALGHVADQIFFSIESWAERYRTWFPETPVGHLPVGSNLPRIRVTREEARERIGISSDSFVVGVFGSIGVSRLAAWMSKAVQALEQEADDLVVLYVGGEGQRIRDAGWAKNLVDAGLLPAEDASLHLSAMDLYLSPYVDGVSTRRGAFMAGLQHGLPCATTIGEHTDTILREHEGAAFLATPTASPELFVEAVLRLHNDKGMRTDIGAGGKELYGKEFTFETVASRLFSCLSRHTTTSNSFA